MTLAHRHRDAIFRIACTWRPHHCIWSTLQRLDGCQARDRLVWCLTRLRGPFIECHLRLQLRCTVCRGSRSSGNGPLILLRGPMGLKTGKGSCRRALKGWGCAVFDETRGDGVSVDRHSIVYAGDDQCQADIADSHASPDGILHTFLQVTDRHAGLNRSSQHGFTCSYRRWAI